MSLAEVEAVFTDVIQVTAKILHSQTESRQLAIGRSSNGRAAYVVFTLRSKSTGHFIRPISARYMHDKEFGKYG